MGTKYLLNLSGERKEMVYSISQQAEISIADLFRRMMDYCLREQVMNQIVPHISGRIEGV